MLAVKLVEWYLGQGIMEIPDRRKLQPRGEFWGDEGWHREVTVDHNPSYRVSAVLGPDGYPLQVGYIRPRVGYDLSPRKPPQ